MGWSTTRDDVESDGDIGAGGDAALSAVVSNRRYYEDPAIVDRYDRDRERGLTDRERRAVDRYFPNREARVLDLGCGAGRTTTALADLGYDVVGLDVSEGMVRAAREGAADVPYLLGDATRLPFPADSFRYALFSYNGIDEILPTSRRDAALDEVNRVLEPGGAFVFSSNNARWLALPTPPTVESVLDTVRYWRANAREGLVGSPYKLDPDGTRTVCHYATPRAIGRRLRDRGFEPLAVLGRGGVLSRLFSPSLYYAARTPPEPTDGTRKPAANAPAGDA